MKFLVDFMQNYKRGFIETIAIALVVIGLFLTYSQLKQNEKLSRDTYLTGLWNNIIKESINLPRFQDKNITSSYKTSFEPMEKLKYESYARWIGGFIEDLHYHDYKKEGLMFFEPTIETFLNLHCVWFKEHIEYYKHTKVFYAKLDNMECL